MVSGKFLDVNFFGLGPVVKINFTIHLQHQEDVEASTNFLIDTGSSGYLSLVQNDIQKLQIDPIELHTGNTRTAGGLGSSSIADKVTIDDILLQGKSVLKQPIINTRLSFNHVIQQPPLAGAKTFKGMKVCMNYINKKLEIIST